MLVLFEIFLGLIGAALVVCFVVEVRDIRKTKRRILDGQSVSGPHRANRWR